MRIGEFGFPYEQSMQGVMPLSGATKPGQVQGVDGVQGLNGEKQADKVRELLGIKI